MKKNIRQRMQRSLDDSDTRVAEVKVNRFGQKKKIYKEKAIPPPQLKKKKEPKERKTITMNQKNSIVLKALSDELKVSQSEVVEKLIEVASEDYYEKELHAKFKKLFS